MKKSILIVDDDADMCKTLKSIFDVSGFDAEITFAGSDAIKLAEKKNYNIVLADLVMGEMNGIQFAEKLREKSPSTSVFIMTAFTKDELIGLGFKNEINVPMFRKPFDIEDMIKTFNQEIDKNSK